MISAKYKAALLSIVLAALLMTVGCGKLTKENYAKIKAGMGYDEVVDILGKADDCSSAIGMMDCTWGDKDKNINIKFAGQKVMFFSMHGL